MFSQFEAKGKTFTNVITKEPVAVHIQTASHLIRGSFHVRPDERLKDELNNSETFIAVTDAKVYTLDGKLVQKCSFLAVNSAHIIWLFQDEEAHQLGEEE